MADGKPDGTVEVARQHEARGVRLLQFPSKLGKGGAVFEGMRQARFDYIGYLDADGPIAPEEYLRLLSVMNGASGILASRWIEGSRIVRQEPAFNIVAGRIWNAMVRFTLALSVRDTQCGAKIFSRSAITTTLPSVMLTNRAFEVDLLYHLKKEGHELREVPVAWEHDAESRMPVARAIPVMFLSLLGIRLMNSPLRGLFPDPWVKRFLKKYGVV